MGTKLPFIRWALTILLLVVIGFHAHWAVTLAFTLLFIKAEIEYFIAARQADRLQDMMKGLKL